MTQSWVRELTKFLLLERWIQEDVIARLEIQVGSPDSSVKVALVALLRLLEASISFLDRLIELLEELVSVPPIHGRPLPDSFVQGEEGGRPAQDALKRSGAGAPMHMIVVCIGQRGRVPVPIVLVLFDVTTEHTQDGSIVPFDLPVSLRVVGRGERVRDAEQLAHT